MKFYNSFKKYLAIAVSAAMIASPASALTVFADEGTEQVLVGTSAESEYDVSQESSEQITQSTSSTSQTSEQTTQSTSSTSQTSEQATEGTSSTSQTSEQVQNVESTSEQAPVLEVYAYITDDTAFAAVPGTEVSGQYIKIGFTNCVPADIGSAVAGITGLPEGLSLKVSRYDTVTHTATLLVSGTPVNACSDLITLVIPTGKLIDNNGNYIQEPMTVRNTTVGWNISAAAEVTDAASQNVDNGPTTAEEAQEISDSTNEELISAQTILELPQVEADFRFIHLDVPEQFFAQSAFIYSDMTNTACIIGAAEKGDSVYTLLKEENDWLYVESGTVRGFVKTSKITDTKPVEPEEPAAVQSAEGTESTAQTTEAAEVTQTPETDAAAEAAVQTDAAAAVTEETVTVTETVEPAAEPTEVPEAAREPEGPSYAVQLSSDITSTLTYTKTSAMDVVIDKVYLISDKQVSVLEEKDSEKARAVGTLPASGIAYLINDEKDGWYFVESGDVRGFVKADDLCGIEESAQRVSTFSESAFAEASELIEPEENKNLYHTITSVKEGTVVSAKAQALIQYASQFLGNPYVWGGTDPVNGSDCSGFVQTVYSTMGYSLPRTSREQSVCSTQISLDSLSPGDLVFYASAGVVYHVMIYIGNGQTLESAGDAGVTIRNLSYDAAVWGVRVITDDDHGLTSASGVLQNEKLITDKDAADDKAVAAAQNGSFLKGAAAKSGLLIAKILNDSRNKLEYVNGTLSCACLNISVSEADSSDVDHVLQLLNGEDSVIFYSE